MFLAQARFSSARLLSWTQRLQVSSRTRCAHSALPGLFFVGGTFFVGELDGLHIALGLDVV